MYMAERKSLVCQYEQAVEWACQCAKRMAGEQASSQGGVALRFSQQIRERVGRITPAEDDPQRLAQLNGGVAPTAEPPASDGILLRQ